MSYRVAHHALSRLLVVAVAVLAGACASLPDVQEVARTPSYALSDPGGTRLQESLQPLLDSHPGQSGFLTLPIGEEAFIARLRLVEAAQKTLDVQYYIWHEDLTGAVLHHQVLAAADRGVRVRILQDDLNTAGMDPTLRMLDAHENIEVRLFNPFANRELRADDMVTDTQRINHRMHNKTLTADAIATVFGGRNIGDEYFAANTEVIFGDMDVLAVGPIAGEVSSQFDLYWNSEWAYPIASLFQNETVAGEELSAFRKRSDEQMASARQSRYAEALGAFALLREDNIANLDFAWSDWVLAYDSPSKVDATEVSAETHLAPKLLEGLAGVQRDLLIVSPYFVPGEKFTDFLISLVDRGVRVRILTNSLLSNDVAAVHAVYIRYREALVRGGVELYELRADAGRKVGVTGREVDSDKSSLHAKFFVLDEERLWVGSYNMDGRSTIFNTELGAYFSSPDVARRLSEDFDDDLLDYAFRVELDKDGGLQWVTFRNGQEELLHEEPDTDWWERVTTGVMSVIAPEKQL
ncbi:MAG: phospholipase D family protein [Halioglobus sp.]